MKKSITLAETAGFCFGVNRAIELVNSLLDEGKKVCTLGPIIHNEQVVQQLADRGVVIAETPDDVPEDHVLVIRSHGVPLPIYKELQQKQLVIQDATCPFVSKIHSIVTNASQKGDIILIAGNSEHPEVLGIKSRCSNAAYTFRDDAELSELLKNNPELKEKSVSVVAQTTFNTEIWKKCLEIFKKDCTNATLFDTICSATQSRQQEAAELSEKCDLMIVIGGLSSSNTAKLFHICSGHCRSVLIQTADDLPVDEVKAATNIGVTAGASTPADIIKEVLSKMSEIQNNENFEELLEESFKNSNINGKVVKGTVVGITPTEVYVDVGRKQSGIVELKELTDDPNAKPEDLVKVGDELELIILKTNDQEGYIYLSKKILESRKTMEKMIAASPKVTTRRRRRDDEDESEVESETVESTEEKETVVFEGVVTQVIKGGVLVACDSVSVFIPASQCMLKPKQQLDSLLRQKVKFVIIEVIKGGRGRVIGSIKKLAEKTFWDEIEPGKTYTGVVKSMTSYGVFVNLGPVDGMIHKSELSWDKIKDPKDVLSIGDVVEVRVKDVKKDKKNISLAYKKAEDNPWEILKNSYPIGSVIEAKVVGTPSFGAFVNILPGLDGLIHISQLSLDRVEKPTDVVKVGDVVTAAITNIDFENKHVSLSIKEVLKAQAEAAAATEQPVEETAEEETADAE
ncbi:MAG: 4-hydroxy-3-methylbut-2-enyl diphosphate reductase [Clostridia bacterium]|nr:4-hydroxy-3-methylbut-2-enyl diphosphate reductase [Clostridia bacterium]